LKPIKKQILELIPKSSYSCDRVVILENSNSLYPEGAANTFREFLIENKIRHNVIYNLDKLDKIGLQSVAENCLSKLVVFETTGITDSYHELMSIFIQLTHNGHRFRFMECSVYNFQRYRLPDYVGEGCLSYHNLQCCQDSELNDWDLQEVTK